MHHYGFKQDGSVIRLPSVVQRVAFSSLSIKFSPEMSCTVVCNVQTSPCNPVTTLNFFNKLVCYKTL